MVGGIGGDRREIVVFVAETANLQGGTQQVTVVVQLFALVEGSLVTEKVAHAVGIGELPAHEGCSGKVVLLVVDHQVGGGVPEGEVTERETASQAVFAVEGSPEGVGDIAVTGGVKPRPAGKELLLQEGAPYGAPEVFHMIFAIPCREKTVTAGSCLAGDEMDGPGLGAPAEEGPLGAPEYLDTLHVVEFRRSHRGPADGHVVEIDRDPRLGGETHLVGGKPPDDIVGTVGRLLPDLQSGYKCSHLRQIPDVVAGQEGAPQSGDASGDVGEVLLPLLRGDRHRIQRHILPVEGEVDIVNPLLEVVIDDFGFVTHEGGLEGDHSGSHPPEVIFALLIGVDAAHTPPDHHRSPGQGLPLGIEHPAADQHLGQPFTDGLGMAVFFPDLVARFLLRPGSEGKGQYQQQ